MPDPQVIFIRSDVEDEEYQRIFGELFKDEKYPEINISQDTRFSELKKRARELNVEEHWKVFYYGSESIAFRRFRESPSFENYRMAHLP